MRRLLTCGLAALLFAPGLRAEEKPTAPKGLELTVLTAKEAYPLEASGMSAKNLKEELDRIDALAKERKQPRTIPAAPKVELTLVIKNTSEKEQTVTLGGDDSLISLQLKGPGARQATQLLATTADFRIGNPITIKPGETHKLELSTLEHGFRGRGSRLYWTEPGEYTLTAIWKTGETDGVPGVVLTSQPLTFKVLEK